MKEGFIKDTYEAIIKDIQSIITISYFVAVGIGMLFNYQKFSEFGINIFDYADVFDFLIAPFTDFYIFLFSLVSILVSMVIIRVDIYIFKKYPRFYSKLTLGWDKKSWYDVFRYASFGLIIVLYLYLAADIYGETVKNQIIENPTTEIKYVDNEIIRGIVLGKTKEILFLLEDGNVKAIPITSLVKEFEIK